MRRIKGSTVAGCICAFVLSQLLATTSYSQGEPVDWGDFSKSNSVSLVLSKTKRGQDLETHGLEHISHSGDGRTTVMNVQNVDCRVLAFEDERYCKGYFYFALHPSFKTNEFMNLKFEVEYFDGFPGKPGVFGLQYHSSKTAMGSLPYKQLLPNITLKGSGKWLKNTFHVKDALFDESQKGPADFRLWSSPPELCVSQITVKREQELPPIPEPLVFNANGEAPLKVWNLQWDAGAKPSFASSTTNQAGSNWLEIHAPGLPANGSWRTSVMLNPGHYQFIGKVRMTGIEEDDVTSSTGVRLRISGWKGKKLVSVAPEGTTLSCDFALSVADQVELVCEFGGSEGQARFDLDSLKLVRKTDQ